MKIIKKYYKLDENQVFEGTDFFEQVVASGETRSKAKAKIASVCEDRDIHLLNGDRVTFLNAPIHRCKNIDLVEYKGETMKRFIYEARLRQEEHNAALTKILEDNSITHCYISKRGSYYGPNYCGYTESVLRAGVYSKHDAVAHCLNILEVNCVPIKKEQHNDRVNMEIKRLKQCLI